MESNNYLVRVRSVCVDDPLPRSKFNSVVFLKGRGGKVGLYSEVTGHDGLS